MNPPEQNRDDNEQKLLSANLLKLSLMKSSTRPNTNLYDHITKMLLKLMNEQPHNPFDVFEDLSHDVKRDSFAQMQSTLRDTPQTAAAELLAEQQCQLFCRSEEDEPVDDGEEETTLPNLSEVGFYFEQAGVGLSRLETQRVFLSLKQLIESKSLLHCQFWGKILGTEANYFVAEATPQDREEEVEEESKEEEKEQPKQEGEQEDPQTDDEIRPLPLSTYKPKPVAAKEANGTGANKFVYYVCNEAGLPWVLLPSVTPAQINVARQIRKLFTGRLDAAIVSFPPFPGNETNYLRAQIARISAGTQVSPEGFYMVGYEKLDEQDDETMDSYEVNPEFEELPVSKMAVSFAAWVHHGQNILQQGRCTRVAAPRNDSSDEEEDSEEEDEEQDELDSEVEHHLLTPLSQDEELFNTPPWSLKMSSLLTSEHAVAVLRSNIWPGAFAYYGAGKKYNNMYIGWGLKLAVDGYRPYKLPFPQDEYVTGDEITEQTDPTLEEENEEKDRLEEKQTSEEEEDSDEDSD